MLLAMSSRPEAIAAWTSRPCCRLARPSIWKGNHRIMRNTLFALVAAVCVAATSGCCGNHWWGHSNSNCNNSGCGCDQGCGYCGANCGACGPGGCPGTYPSPGGCGCGCVSHNSDCSPVPDCADDRAAVNSQLGGPAGPPTAQVTYPYYTVRGPRDFFANNPSSIGP
jgi:hypothetical protein